MTKFKFTTLLLAPVAAILIGLAGQKHPHAITGPSISLSPAATHTTPGQEISIAINLNTGDFASSATDVFLSYPAQYLKYKASVKGDFYPHASTTQADEVAGRIRLTAYTKTPGEMRQGGGLLATLKFDALSPGTAEIVFICSGPQNETAVLNNEGNNILNCVSVSNAKVSISTSPPTPTPTPLRTSSQTPSPTPTTTVITYVDPQVTPIATDTPTPFLSPTPIQLVEVTPTPQKSGPNPTKLLGIAFILISIIIAFLSFSSRKKEPLPPAKPRPTPPTRVPPPTSTDLPPVPHA